MDRLGFAILSIQTFRFRFQLNRICNRIVLRGLGNPAGEDSRRMFELLRGCGKGYERCVTPLKTRSNELQNEPKDLLFAFFNQFIDHLSESRVNWCTYLNIRIATTY